MPTWPIQTIRELLEPTLAHMGYDLYAVEQAGSSGRTLRIAIDRPEGVTVGDCERVSKVAGPLLDQADLITGGRYELEVSSPGAERPLRTRADYDRFVGKKVNVRYRVGDSEAVLEGELVAVDDAGVAVQGKRADVHHIPWADIQAARLTVSL
ncbi:MAG: ribosome maturation factor RimP [Chloroflexi bacterium]|nr:MAG: ribosome maturation factor RimP [Chloroflexota bacterium]